MTLKHLLIIQSLSLLIIFSCNNSTDNNEKISAGVPKIEFNEIEFDFGKITSGEKVTHRFKYKNTGNGKLKITETVAGCGCSSVKIDKNPINADQTSYIEVTFDSKGFHGLQIKEIEVFTNASNKPINLIISANVDI